MAAVSNASRRLVVLLVLLGGALSAAPAPAQGPGVSTTVAVALNDAKVTLAPDTVAAGSVVFKIVNRGKVARDFEFGGKKTPNLASGKSATLHVTVTTGKNYPYYSTATGRTSISGVLLVVDAPCASPNSSTLTLRMSEAGIQISKSHVPCGTVTFVVKNAGKIVHSLSVLEPGSQRLATGGAGPRLKPGETARLTVHFRLKGRAFYYCREPEHDEMYGETGFLALD